MSVETVAWALIATSVTGLIFMLMTLYRTGDHDRRDDEGRWN